MVHIPTVDELVVVLSSHRHVEIGTMPVEGESDALEAEMEHEHLRGQISPPTQDVNGHCRVVDGQDPRIRRPRVVVYDVAVTFGHMQRVIHVRGVRSTGQTRMTQVTPYKCKIACCWNASVLVEMLRLVQQVSTGIIHSEGPTQCALRYRQRLIGPSYGLSNEAIVEMERILKVHRIDPRDRVESEKGGQNLREQRCIGFNHGSINGGRQRRSGRGSRARTGRSCRSRGSVGRPRSLRSRRLWRRRRRLARRY